MNTLYKIGIAVLLISGVMPDIHAMDRESYASSYSYFHQNRPPAVCSGSASAMHNILDSAVTPAIPASASVNAPTHAVEASQPAAVKASSSAKSSNGQAKANASALMPATTLSHSKKSSSSKTTRKRKRPATPASDDDNDDSAMDSKHTQAVSASGGGGGGGSSASRKTTVRTSSSGGGGGGKQDDDEPEDDQDDDNDFDFDESSQPKRKKRKKIEAAASKGSTADETLETDADYQTSSGEHDSPNDAIIFSPDGEDEHANNDKASEDNDAKKMHGALPPAESPASQAKSAQVMQTVASKTDTESSKKVQITDANHAVAAQPAGKTSELPSQSNASADSQPPKAIDSSLSASASSSSSSQTSQTLSAKENDDSIFKRPENVIRYTCTGCSGFYKAKEAYDHMCDNKSAKIIMVRNRPAPRNATSARNAASSTNKTKEKQAPSSSQVPPPSNVNSSAPEAILASGDGASEPSSSNNNLGHLVFMDNEFNEFDELLNSNNDTHAQPDDSALVMADDPFDLYTDSFSVAADTASDINLSRAATPRMLATPVATDPLTPVLLLQSSASFSGDGGGQAPMTPSSLDSKHSLAPNFDGGNAGAHNHPQLPMPLAPNLNSDVEMIGLPNTPAQSTPRSDDAPMHPNTPFKSFGDQECTALPTTPAAHAASAAMDIEAVDNSVPSGQQPSTQTSAPQSIPPAAGGDEGKSLAQAATDAVAEDEHDDDNEHDDDDEHDDDNNAKVATPTLTAENKYKCDFCRRPILLANLETFRRHLNKHHKDKEDAIALAKKLTSSIVEKEYQCPQCAESYKHQQALNRHIRKRHSELLKFACICGKKFSNKSALGLHHRAHKGQGRFKCQGCKATFNDIKTAKSHRKRSNHPSAKIKVSQAATDAVAEDEHDNDEHMDNIVPSGQYPSTQTSAPQSIPPPATECAKCNYSCATKQILIQHIRSNHPELLPIECKKCGERFPNKHGLILHTKRHGGQGNFKCADCDAAFFSPQGAALHEKRSNHSSAKIKDSQAVSANSGSSSSSSSSSSKSQRTIAAASSAHKSSTSPIPPIPSRTAATMPAIPNSASSSLSSGSGGGGGGGRLSVAAHVPDRAPIAAAALTAAATASFANVTHTVPTTPVPTTPTHSPFVLTGYGMPFTPNALNTPLDSSGGGGGSGGELRQ